MNVHVRRRLVAASVIVAIMEVAVVFAVMVNPSSRTVTSATFAVQWDGSD